MNIIPQPFVIKNLISPDLVSMSQFMVELAKRSPQAEFDDKLFHRKQVHSHYFFDAMHRMIFENFKNFDELDLLKDAVKPSYSFLSMYFEGRGVCPKHVDRNQCKMTIDLCIGQKEPWSFFAEVDGETREYILNPGDALILSGTDHPHWREPIQKNNYCDLVFFHFVAKDFVGDLK